jgi:hypothetical protein
MTFGLRALSGLLLLATAAGAADPFCPAYPAEQRSAHEARLSLERSAAALRQPLRARSESAGPQQVARNNFIDDHIFGALEAAGVAPAPLSSDLEFLRRATLDLAGRLPALAEVEEFSDARRKPSRASVIDRLMASDAYIDAWTKFWGDRYEITPNYYDLIGHDGRNAFHQYLRDFVRRDRSYRDLALEMMTATGENRTSGPANFIVRAIQPGDPEQDTWDVLTNRITSLFLGVQTQCVSCHDGARHLEPINLYLTQQKRGDFLRQSAFVSRIQILGLPTDAQGRSTRTIILDRPTGAYHGVIDSNNPGPRPARGGGPYTPKYFFDGFEPAGGAWRAELASRVVNDRQFARNIVNVLWAHFFRVGIVDPVDGWDLARIDPGNPPPAPWTLQPSHPELLEALADELIRQNYRLGPLIRLMATSAAYQLSSRRTGEWTPEMARLYAKSFPRRLTAVELYDAISDAAGYHQPLYVRTWPEPVYRAAQLPDPTEPFRQWDVYSLLVEFGQGDWFNRPTRTGSSVIQALTLMNYWRVNYPILGVGAGFGGSRTARLLNSANTEQQIVRELFMATLSRPPTAEETQIALAAHDDRRPDEWIGDLLWALINKTEFIFNH